MFPIRLVSTDYFSIEGKIKTSSISTLKDSNGIYADKNTLALAGEGETGIPDSLCARLNARDV